MLTHLTKEEMLDKVFHAAQIFKHEGLYSLDIKWNVDTGVINLTIIAEIK